MMIYDFFKAFRPLPIFDQGSDPTCFRQQWANHLNAFRFIWDGVTTDYTADDLRSHEDGHLNALVFDMPDGQFYTQSASSKKIPGHPEQGYWAARGGITKESITNAIIKNGVIQAAVPSSLRSFQTPWRLRGRIMMPQVKVITNDGGTTALNHNVLIVGVSTKGPVCLNSWGWWGRKGRAILTWDWCFKYGISFGVDTFMDHPVDSVVLPE